MENCYSEVFAGYIEDHKKLLESASGGAVTVISEAIIKRGGIVFGAKYSSDFHSAEYCCIDKMDALGQIKGSKYTSTSKKNLFSRLRDELLNDRIVLFVGLGCDVGAVKQYIQNNHIPDKNLFTIDILCHGPAADGVFDSFITELEEKYKSSLQALNMRYKKNGWGYFYIQAIFKNGKVYSTPFDESDFGKAFYKIARPSCTRCQFKGSNHKGDICCGDYWGLKSTDIQWNKDGVSIIIVQTEKGQELVKCLGEEFRLFNADPDEVFKYNPMYNKSRSQEYDYELFMRHLKERGLHYAVKQFPRERHSFSYYINKLIYRVRNILR